MKGAAGPRPGGGARLPRAHPAGQGGVAASGRRTRRRRRRFGGSGFSISSPPAIYKNLAILGGSQGENAFVGPPGDPQAFDVKTGKLVWRFHVVPQPGDKNDGTWGDGWKDRGGPAIWGLMTVDTERGMVFMPTGNPGGSFYGGDRPGDNLYAVSVLALDAATGAYKWHYQTTRHDLFDADLAAAPALIDVVRDGKRIPAVAQVTKMGGMLFILDRVTGKPIHGVEDRKVPLERRARREERADAAVPAQARAVGAARHDEGGSHDRHARVEQVLHRVVGEGADVQRRPLHAVRREGRDRRVQRHDRRRQLGRRRLQPAARLRLRQHEQPRDARPDGARPAEPGQ